MVVKCSKEFARRIAHCYGTSEIEKNLPEPGKKVVLSIKTGKKRRLVKGKIRFLECFDRWDLSYETVCQFVPNNPVKFQLLTQ